MLVKWEELKGRFVPIFMIINAIFILLSWLGVNDNLIYVIKYSNCQARVQVPNPLSQQAPNPDPKVRPSLNKLSFTLVPSSSSFFVHANPSFHPLVASYPF